MVKAAVYTFITRHGLAVALVVTFLLSYRHQEVAATPIDCENSDDDVVIAGKGCLLSFVFVQKNTANCHTNAPSTLTF